MPRTSIMIVIIRQITASNVIGEVKSPSATNVSLLPTIMPPSFKPINVMKNPIPEAIAYFKFRAIILIIFSRILNKLNSVKMIPATKTPVKVTCQSIPIPIHTEKVKNEFNPILGAIAIGKLASNPIRSVPMIAVSAVAVNTAP